MTGIFTPAYSVSKRTGSDGGAHNFVPVVAVSGSGKSSLLRAGLAKGLRDRPVVGLATRARCYLRPSSQPCAELLTALVQQAVQPNQALLNLGKEFDHPEELAEAIRAAVASTELILVVDQFEHLYTECEDVTERRRFIQLLRHLASDVVKVVIGLRRLSRTS
jgi:hypothetical protein